MFHKPGETVQLHAVVHWTDGTAEDVTPICRYQTNDDALAKVDPSGLVTCLGKGDTQVVAFYDNGITPVPVFLPVSDLVGPKYPATPTANKIDELVSEKAAQTRRDAIAALRRRRVFAAIESRRDRHAAPAG